MPRRIAKSATPQRPGRAERALLLELGAELQQLTFELQAQAGISPRDRKRLYTLAQSKRRRPSKVSDEVLATYVAMADILSAWLRDPRYVGSDGSPKTIPVHGKGVTFEALVRRLIPTMSIAEAVKLLIAHSDARRQSNDRIALLGKGSLILEGAKEITLAILIQRLRRLASTVITNQELPQDERSAGRYDREVRGYMTQDEYEAFASSVRQQLQDLIEHVDERVMKARSAKGKRYPCGVTLYLWADFKPRRRK